MPRFNAKSIAYCRTMARASSGLVALVGLAALAGWIYDVPSRKNLLAGWLALPPDTALAFLLAGGTLWLLAAGESGMNPRRRLPARAGAVAVALIGALTLVQYASGPNPGIGGLFAGGTGESGRLWRMSPFVGADLLLLGLSLLQVASSSRSVLMWVAQLGALVAAFGAMVALSGYLYGQEAFKLVPFFESAAPDAAMALLVLSVGVLCARPKDGLMASCNAASAGGSMLRWMLPVVVLLPAMIDWLELLGERWTVFPPGFGWMIDAPLTAVLGVLLAMYVAHPLHEKDIAQETAESELRASEDRFRAIFEQAALGIGVASINGRILRANDKYCEITGYSVEEMRSLSFRDITHPDDWEANQRQVRRVLLGEIASFTLEKRYVRKDSLPVWVTLTASVVRDSDGRPDYFISIIKDITNRRSLEAQLHQSQKMEAVGLLAGGIAHDFNNMLMAIQGNATLMGLTNTLSPAARESLGEITRTVQRATALTRQLLLFSRREVMQPGRMDLNETVTQLARMLQRLIGEDVHMRLLLHSQPLPVHADSGMIEQVLMNLVVNARDAMPGGGDLTIETAEAIVEKGGVDAIGAEPGRYACLSVSDTGSGIPPEVLSRIFEPFFTTKEPGKGTGLGLSTVFGIVKQHGGWVKVHSEPGRGTTFRVFLPLIDPPEETTTLSGEAIEPLQGGGETVLLVEDDEAVRELMRVTLESHGYRVVAASTGREALLLWDSTRGPIDLLFTDIVMPDGVSGIELAVQLQRRRADLKVVFTSGYCTEIAGGALKLGVGQRFLQKPFETDQLLAALNALLHD